LCALNLWLDALTSFTARRGLTGQLLQDVSAARRFFFSLR